MGKGNCEILRAACAGAMVGAGLVAWAGGASCCVAAEEGPTLAAAVEPAAEEAAVAKPAAAERAAVERAVPTPAAVAEAPTMVSAGGVEWFADYYAAYRAASEQKRFLLINVTPKAANGSQPNSTQSGAEKYIAGNAKVREQMANLVLLRVAADATIAVDGKSQRLLSFPAFAELQGGAGFVLIDLRNSGESYYGYAVSVLPYAGGKYYHWRPDYLSVVLSIPAGTLTQRTMIWAVRIHPEGPQSTWGTFHPALASGAMQQASYQANAGVQGHQNFESRYHSLSGAAGGSVSEVCAESWPGENLIDSCIDCVDSWRHSSGHWQGVSSRHRAFGYDIRRGHNGIWYGTGIFAD